jgi:hypothetical protein
MLSPYNKTISAYAKTTDMTDGGGVDATRVAIFANVWAAIQENPAPREQVNIGGETVAVTARIYTSEPKAADLHYQDVIINDATAREYEVLAATEMGGGPFLYRIACRKL